MRVIGIPGGVGSEAELQANMFIGETDRLGHETLPRVDVRVVDSSDPGLAAFPGTWGLDNRYAVVRGDEYFDLLRRANGLP